MTIAYIDVFRAIPLLIIILLISGGVPFLTFLPKGIRIPQWFGQPDPFWYGVAALTLVYGAYMAEVYRAGIEAVPQGPDGGGALARHEPLPGDAPRHRPAGGDQDPGADAERIDLAAEGHDAGQRRSPSASRSWSAAKSSPKRLNSSALTLTAVFFLVIILPLARLVDKLITRNQGKITRGAHIEVA